MPEDKSYFSNDFVSREKELPQAGFERAMFCVLGRHFTNLATKGSSAGQAESLNVMQGQRHLFPDKQGQYMYME